MTEIPKAIKLMGTRTQLKNNLVPQEDYIVGSTPVLWGLGKLPVVDTSLIQARVQRERRKIRYPCRCVGKECPDDADDCRQCQFYKPSWRQ